MRLAEYDGKALLRRHGVAVPRGVLVHAGESPPDAVADWPGLCSRRSSSKAGRGKRGLVRVFDKLDGFRDARRLILPGARRPNIPLLLEEAVPIAREIFVALRIDGGAQRLELLVAPRRRRERRRRRPSSRASRSRPTRRRPRKKSLPRSASCFHPISPRVWRVTSCDCRISRAKKIWNCWNQSAGADRRRQADRLRRQNRP